MVSQVFLRFFFFFRFALPLPLVVVGQHQFFTFTSMFPFPLGSLWSWWWRVFRIVVVTVYRRTDLSTVPPPPPPVCWVVTRLWMPPRCRNHPRGGLPNFASRVHVRVGRARFLTAALASQETLHSWDCGVLFKSGDIACRANNSFCILAGVCQQRLDNPVMCAK